MQNDAAILLTLCGTVILFVLCSVFASKQNLLPQWLCRKILHFAAVGACAVAPVLLEELAILRLIIALIIPVLFLLVRSNLLFPEKINNKNWGIVFFPVAFFILLLAFGETNRPLIFFSMAILAICDAAAGICGKLFPRSIYNLTGDQKTITGSIGFLISFLLFFVLILTFFPDVFKIDSFAVLFCLLPLLGIQLTIVEALGSSGWDNFFIPMISSVFLLRINPDIQLYEIAYLYLLGVFAIGFSLLVIRLKALSLDGAVMACSMAFWIGYLSDLTFLIPLIAYFVSSVVIGRLLKGKSAASDDKQGKPRDWIQVLSNGGFYALALTVYFFDPVLHFSSWLTAGIVISVAMADTWASEIGSRFKGKVIDIIKWKSVPAGISGGISLIGTLAGLAGAIVISAIHFMIVPESPEHPNFLTVFLFLSVSGLAGMLIDSVLGSLFQAKYQQNTTGKLMDKAANGAILVSGYKWMTNDRVNQLSILITLILSLMIFGLFR